MVTKRQLGIFLVVVASAAAGAILVIDRLGAGEWSGFGPLQRIGLAAGLLVLATGLILISRGDRPA